MYIDSHKAALTVREFLKRRDRVGSSPHRRQTEKGEEAWIIHLSTEMVRQLSVGSRIREVYTILPELEVNRDTAFLVFSWSWTRFTEQMRLTMAQPQSWGPGRGRLSQLINSSAEGTAEDRDRPVWHLEPLEFYFYFLQWGGLKKRRLDWIISKISSSCKILLFWTARLTSSRGRR